MPRAPELFTTAEAAALAQAPARSVEKAIEEGIVEVRKARADKAGTRARRLLSAEGIYFVAFVHGCELQFSRRHKHRLWRWFKTTPADRLLTARWRFSASIEIRPGELVRPVLRRVKWYVHARDRWIVSDPGIKGGTPVIKGTRMSVYAVAGRLAHGDTLAAIAEENPDLGPRALEAAVAYARANPLLGRPGARPWRA